MDLEEELFSPLPSATAPPPIVPLEETAVVASPLTVSTPLRSRQTNMTQNDGDTSNLTGAATVNTEPVFGGNYAGTVHWIGGPPNENFDGVVSTGPQTPLCFRNLDATSEIKGFAKRTAGAEIKFKRDNPEYSLVTFADAALQHMQTHGMDTPFYMQGAKDDGTGGMEVFTYHTHYTKKVVKEAIAGRPTDKYNNAALSESALWLANSLDTTLRSSLRTQLSTRPSGPVLWMMIVAEVQSDSLKRCDALADKFRSLSLASTKGENVRDYAATASDILTQLERDRQLPRTHLIRILDVFASCSVMDFKIHFMQRRAAIQQFVKDSAGKTDETIQDMDNYVHFSDLLEEGKEQYTNLSDQWGPAKNVKPPESAMTAALKKLDAKVSQLDQKLTAKSPEGKKSEGKHCYGCGKKNYTKKTCPNCSKKKDEKDKDKDKKDTDDNKKFAPPKDGEPTEKMIDGVLHKYCSKCYRGKGRWTKGDNAHKTDEHRSGFLKEQRAATTGGDSANLAQSLSSRWDI